MTPLFDTHQHLIYPDRLGYGWTDGIDALKNQAFTLESYHALTKDQGVMGTLFMEAGTDDPDYSAEVSMIADLMKADESLRGIIASCRPEDDSGFEAWLETCAALGVAGYRRILHVMPDDLSQSEAFRANVRKIGAQSKVFDLCVTAKQLPIGLELVRACTNTTFVLNHCGVPDIAGNDFADWSREITVLAGEPSVICKLSGIMAYCGVEQNRPQAITPYVDHVLEVFGPDRMVWGSDWPVINLGGGLPEWLAVTHSILDRLSPDEAAAIGHRNAERIYGVSMTA
ncbi:MAG: amidohydrolase [Pseudomonadota bacterium]